MGSPAKLAELQAKIAQDDAELDKETASIEQTSAAPDGQTLAQFGGVDESKQEANTAPNQDASQQEPAKQEATQDIAAQIEEARRIAVEAAQEQAAAALQEALAAQRAEIEAQVAAEKEAQSAELEALKAYREKEREAAIKVTSEERAQYVAAFGEDAANVFISREEENRKRVYDLENKLATVSKPEQKPVVPREELPEGYVQGVNEINASFTGFNELAQKLGGMPWRDFAKTEKFKKAAQNDEFAELWKSAFHIKAGQIIGVKPVFAGLAQKKLGELLADAKPTGFAVQPGRAAQPKLDKGTDDGKDAVKTHTQIRQGFRAGNKALIEQIGKSLH